MTGGYKFLCSCAVIKNPQIRRNGFAMLLKAHHCLSSLSLDEALTISINGAENL